MGGGRLGLFPGTKGADHQQLSLLNEPIRVHHRGPTYIPDSGSVGTTGGMATGHTPVQKALILIVPKIVLEQCMRYRLGVLSERQLVSWLEKILKGHRYSIAPGLREVIADGLVALKATSGFGKIYNTDLFLAALMTFERRLETL